MYALKFFVCSFLYYFGFIGFVWYINLVEVSDVIFGLMQNYVDPVRESYDYVIVGGGSAGSTVANRLAKNANISILLLEAGPRGGFFMDIPAIAPMMHLSTVDWQYRTQPQENACKAMINNSSAWPMGRILGGTGRLNNLMYTRGHESDFIDWYKDDPDFNYNSDILYYFKKIEKSNGYGSKIQNISFSSRLGDIILNAAATLGYSVEDEQHSIGFKRPQITLQSGSRRTPSHELPKSKPNLHMRTNSQVYKIHFNEHNEAKAVTFTHPSGFKTVRASKGIVLSAGVIGTPKILMLSGIGPKEHLKSLGIEPKVDLPVGENLQDHVTTGYDLITLNKSISYDFSDMCSPYSICNYFFKGKGPWTTIGAEALGFVHSKNPECNFQNSGKCYSIRPDLQFLILPLGVTFEGGKHVLDSTNIKREVFSKYFQPLSEEITISILPVVLHPKSRGSVKLTSADPSSPVLINPNYLSRKEDVRTLIEGVRLIEKFVETGPMKDYGAKIYGEKFPGCEGFVFGGDDYWECYVKQLTLSAFHPVGTCKMGRNDGRSVVDYRFKVYGTDGLYVVDGSVLPSLPSANPNAAIVMLAEKLADVLLEHFSSEKLCLVEELFIKKRTCEI